MKIRIANFFPSLRHLKSSPFPIGLRTNRELAEILGVTDAALSNSLKRERVPCRRIVEVAGERGCA